MVWRVYQQRAPAMQVSLSSRMAQMVAAYLPKVAATLEDRTNTASKIDLATAENWLIRPELVSLYKDAVARELTAATLSYPEGFGGEPALLDALAAFFNRYFRPAVPVSPRHVVVTPGASFCLDALLFSICEAGDVVLVAAPYWSGFDFHFLVRAKVRIVPVHGPSSLRLLSSPATESAGSPFCDSMVPALADAYDGCLDPARVKALVVTNPNNPVGRCYAPDVLEEMVWWCGRKGVHYVSDEVYGLSDFASSPSPDGRPRDGDGDGDGARDGDVGQSLMDDRRDIPYEKTPHMGNTPFVSALALPLESPPAAPAVLPPISVIWSTSKDLGSSGLRIGALVVRSPPDNTSSARALVNASTLEESTEVNTNTSTNSSASPSLLLTSIALLTAPHLATVPALLTRFPLTDPSLPNLLRLNRARLRRNQGLLTRALDTWQVPYVRATSAPFLLARLGVCASRVLPSDFTGGSATDGVEDENEKRVLSEETLKPSCSWADEEKVVCALRERGRVLVAPGRGFHHAGRRSGVDGRGESSDGAEAAGWVRITFAVPEAELVAALERVAVVLQLRMVDWLTTSPSAADDDAKNGDTR